MRAWVWILRIYIKLDIRACHLIIPIMRWDAETREYPETHGPARLDNVVVDSRETHPKQYGRYRQRNLSSDVHMYAVASAGTHMNRKIQAGSGTFLWVLSFNS